MVWFDACVCVTRREKQRDKRRDRETELTERQRNRMIAAAIVAHFCSFSALHFCRFFVIRVGYCLFRKIPMDLLHSSWEKSPTLSLGGRAEMMSTVIMQSCFMKVEVWKCHF